MASSTVSTSSWDASPNDLELAISRRDVERALRLQALASRCCGASRPAARACSKGRARTPARSTSATAWPSSSRSSRTTTRRAVEPFQGAATGVGGIVRDIFTMGARPIALLDSLRFGAARRAAQPLPVQRRGRWHRRLRQLHRACRPWAARSCFDDAYSGNPLVNAMCVGLCRTDRLTTARGRAAWAILCCWSAATPAATASAARRLASQSFDESPRRSGPACRSATRSSRSADRSVPGAARPASCRGDAGPGRGRAHLLDVEMAARGGRRHATSTLSRVPRREPGMTPFEVMLSESQERMAAVVRAGRARAAVLAGSSPLGAACRP